AAPNTVNLRHLEIAHIHRKFHASGNHVLRSWLDRHSSHGDHLPARNTANFFPKREHIARRAGQSVLTVIHWSCAGMIRKSRDHTAPFFDSDDALHNSDG